jgi:hypothetical protein
MVQYGNNNNNNKNNNKNNNNNNINNVDGWDFLKWQDDTTGMQDLLRRIDGQDVKHNKQQMISLVVHRASRARLSSSFGVPTYHHNCAHTVPLHSTHTQSYDVLEYSESYFVSHHAMRHDTPTIQVCSFDIWIPLIDWILHVSKSKSNSNDTRK